MIAKQTILLVEDNSSIAQAVATALRHTYRIDIVATGKQGIYRADRESYDVIVLDLRLPDVPGLAVCQELRERGVTAPILILTAETKILTKIQLLDAGANDYLTKPFSLGEFKARLRVLLRQQAYQAGVLPRYEINNLILDTATYQVTRDGQSIRLRRKEFALLSCLMANADHVVSRDTLARHAWQNGERPWTNTVDVHIKHLRDKIDRPFKQPLIRTVHGVGYRLEVGRAESRQLTPVAVDT
jgi:DNA-binding response OmpR family regulator